MVHHRYLINRNSEYVRQLCSRYSSLISYRSFSLQVPSIWFGGRGVDSLRSDRSSPLLSSLVWITFAICWSNIRASDCPITLVCLLVHLNSPWRRIGNIADALGITFLIFGFIKIVKREQVEEKRIQELEQMLPLCSNCKKYRTEDGQWLPIEKYLIDSGAPKLTHGICPECSEMLYGNILRKKRP